MFSNYLSSIEDVSIFPIIGLVLFFLVFMGILFWVIKKDKHYMEKLANIPFQENDQVIINEENKNEK